MGGGNELVVRVPNNARRVSDHDRILDKEARPVLVFRRDGAVTFGNLEPEFRYPCGLVDDAVVGRQGFDVVPKRAHVAIVQGTRDHLIAMTEDISVRRVRFAVAISPQEFDRGRVAFRDVPELHQKDI